MAPRRLDQEDAIPLYLAGKLTPEESEAFERALPESPELREQIELVLKLKEGLSRLRERGELAPLLRPPARPRWFPYATAAGVAIAFLAAWVWFYRPGAPPNVLALSPPQLVSGHPLPPAFVKSYVLARWRDRAAVTELQRAGVFELRMVPTVPSSAYRVEVRTPGGTRGRIVGELDVGATDADGYVTFYVDSARLAPGDYEVSLSPLRTGTPEPPTDRFPIRLR